MKLTSKLIGRKLRELATTLIVSALALLGLAAQGAPLDVTHAAVQAVMAVQAESTPGLMQDAGVLGTAVGLNAAGQPDLVVYIDREAGNVAALVRSLPPQMRGIGVRAELTDKFYAYRPSKRGTGGGGGVSHTALQAAPIKLGTSGGWRKDLANGYCCGGTLGSLVQANGVQYILSNYHVFESDTVSGGNSTVATTGDYIIQPGLIDVRCSASSAQNVATLRKVSSLPGSNVDVGIAQVLPGMVSPDGAILEIGPLSSQTVTAYLNQAVKKSGRTTGLTRSSVSGLNATISVSYENECAGGTAFTKTFSGQIVLANNGSGFLNSGDSGSLLVEDVASYPHAIGLLFAGSSSSAIANPIDEVLRFVSSKVGTATMVGY